MARNRTMVRSGSRRKSTWMQFTFQQTSNSGKASSIVFSLNAAALALRPFTIVRTYFAFFLQFDQAAGAETQKCAWGIAIVSDQASTVGITAVPTPDTELGSSLWFAIQHFYANATDLTDVTNGGQYFQVDSKAMRKVEIGQDFVVVVENPASTGWLLNQAGRIFIKMN